MLHEIRTRDGACETYWLETSGSRGRVVPRAYAIAILALARRHGFRRQPAPGSVRVGLEVFRLGIGRGTITPLRSVVMRHRERGELSLRPYTGNAW